MFLRRTIKNYRLWNALKCTTWWFYKDGKIVHDQQTNKQFRESAKSHLYHLGHSGFYRGTLDVTEM